MLGFVKIGGFGEQKTEGRENFLAVAGFSSWHVTLTWDSFRLTRAKGESHEMTGWVSGGDELRDELLAVACS